MQLEKVAKDQLDAVVVVSGNMKRITEEVIWHFKEGHPGQQVPMQTLVDGNIVSFSHYAICEARSVPYTADAESVYYTEVAGPEDKRVRFDLMFEVDCADASQLSPSIAPLVRKVCDLLHPLDLQNTNPLSFHFTETWLRPDRLRPISEGNRAYWYVLSVYPSADWPCTEHPEFLVGAPIGQYHCPVCGDMQMAGMMHFPKQEEG